MKILVCVKVIKGELNPFDESALECALNWMCANLWSELDGLKSLARTKAEESLAQFTQSQTLDPMLSNIVQHIEISTIKALAKNAHKAETRRGIYRWINPIYIGSNCGHFAVRGEIEYISTNYVNPRPTCLKSWI